MCGLSCCRDHFCGLPLRLANFLFVFLDICLICFFLHLSWHRDFLYTRNLTLIFGIILVPVLAYGIIRERQCQLLIFSIALFLFIVYIVSVFCYSLMNIIIYSFDGHKGNGETFSNSVVASLLSGILLLILPIQFTIVQSYQKQMYERIWESLDIEKCD